MSGYSGIDGSEGASGYSGYSGTSGESGISGYSGTSGQDGASGVSGYSGVAGEYAASGYSGYSGYSGATGSDGSAGISGVSGYSGAKGSDGTIGVDGASGVSGYSGASGTSGAKGSDGISGYSGTSGTNGVIGNIFPPAHSSTYVKATSQYSTSYVPHFATDPSKPLTGSYSSNAWISVNGTYTNQRFHIDLGSSRIIDRIYYENLHNNGSSIQYGVKNFTLWGSNDASAFADTTYATDTNWTEITGLSQTSFDQHVAANVADPKYITILGNVTAYRYYAFKIADGWTTTGFMGVRRLTLQYAGGLVGLSGFSGYSGYSGIRSIGGMGVTLTSETAAVTASTTVPKNTIYAPYAMTISSVYAFLTTAGSTASTLDIHKNGTTIFSTRPTIDASEYTTATAAAAYAFAAGANVIAANDKLEFFVDTAGTGITGVKMFLL